jgi:hypothetical protein
LNRKFVSPTQTSSDFKFLNLPQAVSPKGGDDSDAAFSTVRGDPMSGSNTPFIRTDRLFSGMQTPITELNRLEGGFSPHLRHLNQRMSAFSGRRRSLCKKTEEGDASPFTNMESMRGTPYGNEDGDLSMESVRNETREPTMEGKASRFKSFRRDSFKSNFTPKTFENDDIQDKSLHNY